MMKFDRTIIIADSNPHVRRFLKREMTAAGYDVLLAFSLQDLLRQIYERISIDLIIVDPDFPNIAAHDFLNLLNNRAPGIPIVVHTHDVSIGGDPGEMAGIHVVEKRDNSTERLKDLASQLLPINDRSDTLEQGELS